MQQILIYLGDNQEKKAILDQILTDLNLPHRFLNDKDLNETLGYLLHLEGFVKNAHPTTLHRSIDFMYLDDIDDETIVHLNALMKAKGISMPRKGMRTPTNEHWKLNDLLSEIEEEHAYFQKLEQLYQLLQDSSSLQIDLYTESSWKNYEKAFYDGYQVLQEQGQPEAVQQALKQLQNAKKALVLK